MLVVLFEQYCERKKRTDFVVDELIELNTHEFTANFSPCPEIVLERKVETRVVFETLGFLPIPIWLRTIIITVYHIQIFLLDRKF